MLKALKFFTLVIMLSMLAGCKTARVKPDENTVVHRVSAEEEAKRKVETAKINAQLGMAYFEKKNIQRAKQKLLLAIKQGPSIPEPWYSMAYFLEATGNRVAAREYYLKAIKVAPERGDAHNNYGTYLCRSGHYRESVKHFLVAAKSRDYLDPAAAYENAGLCAMNIPDYKRAAGYLQQALKEDPARTSSLLGLAKAEYKLGRYNDARQQLKQYTLVANPTKESRALLRKIVKKLG